MKLNEPIYYLNGKFIAKSRTKISVGDLGFVRGYGVFDYIVTYKDGLPFLIKKHLQRLFTSAKLIGLKIPWTLPELEKLINKTIAKNKNGKEKVIRIIITGGESENTIRLGRKPTIVITVNDRKTFPTSFYENGVKAVTYDYNRESPQAKSLNYIHAVKAMDLARKKGALESIYIHKALNKVYEGTQSNLFLIKGNQIITPDGDTLPGITRELSLNICKKLYSTKMREVKIRELYEADELFLSASNKEIMPVVNVDNKIIGNGKPGAVTKIIMSEFRKFIEKGRW